MRARPRRLVDCVMHSFVGNGRFQACCGGATGVPVIASALTRGKQPKSRARSAATARPELQHTLPKPARTAPGQPPRGLDARDQQGLCPKQTPRDSKHGVCGAREEGSDAVAVAARHSRRSCNALAIVLAARAPS